MKSQTIQSFLFVVCCALVFVAAATPVFRYGEQAGFPEAVVSNYSSPQAAIDSSKKITRFTEGTYVISTPLLIPSGEVVIIDEGATLTLADTTNDNMIENSDLVGGNTDITITGSGTLDGNGSNQTAGDIIHIRECVNFKITGNLKIVDSHKWGVSVRTDCTNWHLEGIKQSGSTNGSGMEVNGNCHDGYMVDCSANGNTNNGAGGYGIWLEEVDGSRIHNVVAIGNGDENLVFFDNKNCVIVGSMFNDSTEDGGSHFGGSEDCQIVGCQFNGNDNAGAKVNANGGTSRNMVFIACQFNSNGVTSGQEGIELDSSYAVISGNTIQGNGGAAMRLHFNTPTGNRISNNKIRNNGLNGSVAAIRLSSATASNTIRDNDIVDDQGTSTMTYGVEEVASGSNNKLFDNFIDGELTANTSLSGTGSTESGTY